MNTRKRYEPALDPQDLAKLFVARANEWDADGLTALYEPEATLATAEGQVARGSEAIRHFYSTLFEERPKFEMGEQRPALQNGGIALTSTRLGNGTVTAEVARQQQDGSWLWSVDQPNVGKWT